MCKNPISWPISSAILTFKTYVYEHIILYQQKEHNIEKEYSF